MRVLFVLQPFVLAVLGLLLLLLLLDFDVEVFRVAVERSH